jgi:nitrite reductase (NADH) small subunit
MKDYIVGDASLIPKGEGRIFEVGRLSIGIFNIDGEFFALRNLCPHQGGPLCENKLFDSIEAEVMSDGEIREFVTSEKSIIPCPWHGIEFEVKTGVCLSKKNWKVSRYDVHVNEKEELVVQLP